jgi:hypothetical protein
VGPVVTGRRPLLSCPRGASGRRGWWRRDDLQRSGTSDEDSSRQRSVRCV